jgi:Fic family protein
MHNIERAMAYVEESVQPDSDISQHLLRELHSLTVQELEREGDKTPGQYRQGAVAIALSDHLPPEAIQVQGYMDELIAFINEKHPPKYDLIKVALAHHRFGWIHPFSNGNGRVVRLLTYALLIKYGFNVQAGGRVLNPTAVFCNDRDHYYAMLGEADKGSEQGLETWCIYVLQGILDELRKVDQLTDFDYLQENILIPALEHARERGLITTQEQKLLLIAAKTDVVKAANLKAGMPGLKSSQQTYQIKKLVDAGMLRPVSEGARKYTFGFSHNYLIRGVIRALTEQGFVPASLNQP